MLAHNPKEGPSLYPKTRLRLIATSVLIAALVAAAPNLAQAQPDSQDAGPAKLNLEPASAGENASDAVRALLRGADLESAAISLHVGEDDSVSIYVSKQSFAKIATLIGNATSAIPAPVKVIATPITQEALLAVKRGLVDAVGADATVAVTYSDDRQAIEADVSTLPKGTNIKDLQMRANALAEGAPVHLEVHDTLSVRTASRSADAPVFWGSAATTSGSGVMCSTGMRAKQNGTANYVMLFARHCVVDSSSSTWYAQFNLDSNFQTIPSATGNKQGVNSSTTSLHDDAAFILPNAGQHFDPAIYVGNYLSTSSINVVAGWTPGDNTNLYLDGGIRGQSFGVVVNDNYSITAPHLDLDHGILTRSSGAFTNGSGDSGSPFYSMHSNGVDAIGRGLFSATWVDKTKHSDSDEGPCSQGPSQYKPILVDQDGNIVNICGNYFLSPSVDLLEDHLNVTVQ